MNICLNVKSSAKNCITLIELLNMHAPLSLVGILRWSWFRQKSRLGGQIPKTMYPSPKLTACSCQEAEFQIRKLHRTKNPPI